MSCFVFHYLISWTVSSNENFNGFPWFGTRPLHTSCEYLLLLPASHPVPNDLLSVLHSPLLSLSCWIKLNYVPKVEFGVLVWAGEVCVGFFLSFSVQHEWFLKLNILGRESTVFGEKGPPSDLIPFAEAPLQRFSTSVPKTNLLWAKRQLSVFRRLAQQRLILKGFWSPSSEGLMTLTASLFLPEDQLTNMRLTCLAHLGL